MRKFPIHTTLIAAMLACAPLAFAAGAPQTDTAQPPSASSSSMQSMHHGQWHGNQDHGEWQGMHHGWHQMGMRGGHEGMRAHRWHNGMGMMLKKLDLTDTQKQDIHRMMQQSFQQGHPEMQQVRKQRMAFQNATPGSSDYHSAANKLAEAESKAAHARVMRMADMRTKIYKELTPEQRTRLDQMHAQRQASMQRTQKTRQEMQKLQKKMQKLRQQLRQERASNTQQGSSMSNPASASSTQ